MPGSKEIDEIYALSKTLKRGTDWLTARATEKWVQENVSWRFFNAPRGLEVTWREKCGDCTDMAELMELLLYYNGIWSKKVHGWGVWDFPDGGVKTVKHDWLIAKIRNCEGKEPVETRYDGVRDCKRYEYVGEGIWR